MLPLVPLITRKPYDIFDIQLKNAWEIITRDLKNTNLNSNFEGDQTSLFKLIQRNKGKRRRRE